MCTTQKGPEEAKARRNAEKPAEEQKKKNLATEKPAEKREQAVKPQEEKRTRDDSISRFNDSLHSYVSSDSDASYVANQKSDFSASAASKQKPKSKLSEVIPRQTQYFSATSTPASARTEVEGQALIDQVTNSIINRLFKTKDIKRLDDTADFIISSQDRLTSGLREKVKAAYEKCQEYGGDSFSSGFILAGLDKSGEIFVSNNPSSIPADGVLLFQKRWSKGSWTIEDAFVDYGYSKRSGEKDLSTNKYILNLTMELYLLYQQYLDHKNILATTGEDFSTQFFTKQINETNITEGQKAMASLAGLLPDNVVSLQVEGMVFQPFGGQKENYSVVVATDDKGNVTVIDQMVGVRGQGKTKKEAMIALAHNEVRQEALAKTGTFYYADNGRMQSVLSTASTSDKIIDEIDTWLTRLGIAAFAISMILTWGADSEVAVPGIVALTAKEAAKKGAIEASKLAFRRYLVKEFGEEALNKAALYAGRTLNASWTGRVLKEGWDAQERKEATGTNAGGFEGSATSAASLALFNMGFGPAMGGMALDIGGHKTLEHENVVRGRNSPELDRRYVNNSESSNTTYTVLKEMDASGLYDRLFVNGSKTSPAGSGIPKFDSSAAPVSTYADIPKDDTSRLMYWLLDNMGSDIRETMQDKTYLEKNGISKEQAQKIIDSTDKKNAALIASRTRILLELRKDGQLKSIAENLGLKEDELAWAYLTTGDLKPSVQVQNSLSEIPDFWERVGKSYMRQIYGDAADAVYVTLSNGFDSAVPKQEKDREIASRAMLVLELQKAGTLVEEVQPEEDRNAVQDRLVWRLMNGYAQYGEEPTMKNFREEDAPRTIPDFEPILFNISGAFGESIYSRFRSEDEGYTPFNPDEVLFRGGPLASSREEDLGQVLEFRARFVLGLKDKLVPLADRLGLTQDELVWLYLTTGGPSDSPEKILGFELNAVIPGSAAPHVHSITVKSAIPGMPDQNMAVGSDIEAREMKLFDLLEPSIERANEKLSRLGLQTIDISALRNEYLEGSFTLAWLEGILTSDGGPLPTRAEGSNR